MKKILAILNSKYFLSSVIGLSILVILVGVILVKNANDQATLYAQEQASKQRAEQLDSNTLDQLTAIAAQAQAELEATQSAELGAPKKLNFATDESQKKVDKMLNKNPEKGSEDWCEIMMVKPDTQWTKEEQGVFAENCLN